jgi:hypothetical protein
MSTAPAGPPFDALARKWRGLTDRRLAYFTELYQTGRWQEFYASREAFAARMLDVIKVAKFWRDLSGDPAPIDLGDGERPAAE